MKAQTKYIAIGALAVAVIFGGAYYFAAIENQSSSIGESDLATNTDSTSNATVSTISNTASASVGGSIDNQNFNLAMSDARKAFALKDYAGAIKNYTSALRYKNADTAHVGLYTVYTAQSKWREALTELNKAIDISPDNTDYWKWKISLLDETTDTGYGSLKDTYTAGLKVVNSKTKINLVTYFAGVAERNNQKEDAIVAWQDAIALYPQSTAIYQAEIVRLQSN